MLTRLFKVIHWIGTLMLLYAVLVFPIAFGISVAQELTSPQKPQSSEARCALNDKLCFTDQDIERAVEQLNRRDDIAKGLDPDVEAKKRAEAWRNRTFFERMPRPYPDKLWPETEIYVSDYKLSYPQFAALAYIFCVIVAYIGTGRLTLLPWRIR